MASRDMTIENYMICSICMDVFNLTDKLPKGLPCQHTFCEYCLHGMAKNKSSLKLLCPNCRQEFNIPPEGVTKIPTNIVLREIIENKESEKVEDTGTWHLCESKGTLKLPLIREACNRHKKPGDFACKVCKVAMCDTCLVDTQKGTHATHEIVKLETLFQQLEFQLEKINQSRKAFDHKCNVALERAKRSRDTELQDAETRKNKAIEIIDKWHEDVGNVIEHSYISVCNKIKENGSSVSEELQHLNSRVGRVEMGIVEALLALKALHQVQHKVDALNTDVTVGKFGAEKCINPGIFIPNRHPTEALPDEATEEVDISSKRLYESSYRDEDKLVFGDIIDEKACIKLDVTNSTLVKYCFAKGPFDTYLMTSIRKRLAANISFRVYNYFDKSRYVFSLPNGMIVVNGGFRNSSTIICSTDLDIICKYDGSFGILLDAVAPDLLAYLNTTGRIDLYSVREGHTRVTTLCPRNSSSFDERTVFRVNSNPSTGHFAVLNEKEKSLEIFNYEGTLHSVYELAFTAHHVACTSRYIVLGPKEGRELTVMNWYGRVLKTHKMEHASDYVKITDIKAVNEKELLIGFDEKEIHSIIIIDTKGKRTLNRLFTGFRTFLKNLD